MNERNQLRLFVLNALVGVKNNLDMIAVFEEIINDVGSYIKQRDPEFLAELIRYFETTISEKHKIQIRKALAS